MEDVDNLDSFIFSLVIFINSNLFNISKIMGVIMYVVDYDIDKMYF